MNNTQNEFVKNVCSKCISAEAEECNIKKRIDGEYDCINKKIIETQEEHDNE